ncbi:MULTISPECIES: glycosyltransferase [unclassified Streptomyces]|uniref:glycosyltransferase family 2 protein n=1 Tax=unclassified Streptomyces TaxID=2593676 RepID=UPI0033D38569
MSSTPASALAPAALAVVVPAHNEQHRIGACLHSLRRAAARAAPVPVLIVVAADACTDATAAVAADAGAEVVEIDARNVGAARAAGTDHALERLAGAGERLGEAGERLAGPWARPAGQGVWLAMTDADTTVPEDWLTQQMAWARRGYDAVLGTIRLAPARTGSLIVARHDADYFRTRPRTGRATAWEHPHVHGANMGLTAAAYRRVGGFAALPTGEDHDLVGRLVASGHRVARTDRHPVRTAARLRGRAPGGLADLLMTLRPPVWERPAVTRHAYRAGAGVGSASVSPVTSVSPASSVGSAMSVTQEEA